MSRVSSAEGVTDEIPVLSGIKQGCPLSGLLFVLAIDPVVRVLQGEDEEHRVLALADDLCLIANTNNTNNIFFVKPRKGKIDRRDLFNRKLTITKRV